MRPFPFEAHCVFEAAAAAPGMSVRRRREVRRPKAALRRRPSTSGMAEKATHHPKKVKVPNEMKAHLLLFGLGSNRDG